MGLFGNHARVGASAAGDYEIKRALRFRRESNTYLSRTSSSSDTYTLSVWLKRAYANRDYNVWQVPWDSNGSNQNGANSGIFFRRYGGLLQIDSHISGGGFSTQSTAAFRDSTAWFHLVFQNNSNVVTCYVNNVLVPFSGSVTGFPLGDGTNETRLGSRNDGSYNFDGYMADVHLVDGSIVAPSSFAEAHTGTGQWLPKKYIGGYGTNGFRLTFEDNSGTTATTLGKDSSGNDNNFTPNNFSVAAAPANDSVTDTPTNNYCTLNEFSDASDIEIKEGNLTCVSGTDSWPTIYGTHGASSGKFYFEVKSTDTTRWGVGWSPVSYKEGNSWSDTTSDGYFAYSADPLTRYATGTGTAINGNPAFTSSNLLQVAIDIDAGKIWYGVDNTWVNDDSGNAGNPAAGTYPINTFTGGTRMFPKVINNLGTCTFNFGQQGFAHTPPAGFKELSTKNLAIPTIKKGAKNFDSVIYTGTASDLSITSLEFQPDLLWIKKRNAAANHELRDAVRGVSKRLVPNDSANESTPGDQWGPKAFLSNGFTVGAGPSESNNNGDTFVAWNWNAGSSTVTNDSGSIDSQVRANATAGFSIITYTGNGTDGATIGHGLGVAPSVAIIKARDVGTQGTAGAHWSLSHQSLTGGLNGGGSAKKIYLNLTNAESANSHGAISAASSTTLTFKDGSASDVDAHVNHSGGNYVCYCFAEVEGYSKFGSYEGNSLNEGPYVECGFRPAFVMAKNIDDSTNRHWAIMDNSRSPFNEEAESKVLFADDSSAESPNDNNFGKFNQKKSIDFLSTGFKVREHNTGAYSQLNLSGDTYIFLAFAERPTKYANAG